MIKFKKWQTVLLSVLTYSALMLPAVADSLWNDTSIATIYTDRRPNFVVGGLVTIIVDEKLQATQNASTKGNKKVQNQHKWEIPYISDGKSNTSQLKLDNQVQFAGDGATSRTGNLTFEISARIDDILPNGNLIISAKKQIRVNDEISNIALSGIVRRDDVTTNNKVSSELISDMKIDVNGTGPVSAKSTGGLLSRVFNFLL